MKKRCLALTLAVLLVFGCLPFTAAAANEDELTAVTLAVKAQLGIGDDYTSFYSSSEDLGVLRYWDLQWTTAEGDSLSVAADSDGKILYYYSYSGDRSYSSGSYSYAPAFPSVTAAQVEATAQAFLENVLPSPEGAELEPVTLDTSGSSNYASVRGTITLNGVATDVEFYLRVYLPTCTVTSYSRYDYYEAISTGEIPSAVPTVTAEDAAAKLNSTLSLELRYVDGADGTIQLRYVPTTEGDWYVDAQTGELVDLDAVYAGYNAMGYAMAAAASTEAETAEEDGASGVSLSVVEQETVDQMAGTLSAEDLDAILRGISALGLEGMDQTGASYTMATDGSGDITCTLTYTRTLAEEEMNEWYAYDYDYYLAAGSATIRKTIVVDALTGSLRRVSTSDYMAKSTFEGDETAVIESFLSEQFPEELASSVTEDGQVYYRTVNGCRYLSNSLYVNVSDVDGSIRNFRIVWDDEAEFPATDGAISMDEALAVYAGTYDTSLHYIAYPQPVDTDDAQWLIYSEMLATYTTSWTLAYVLEAENTVYGIDAMTGEALCYTGPSTAAQTYTDSQYSYAQTQIEALAAYGVGFGSSDQFRPTAQVTQGEMLVLLLSALSYSYDVDTMDKDDWDYVYSEAEDLGLITEAERDQTALVTRMDFLKVLLRASDYGKAAQIQGIYQTSFADAAAIDPADLGYAALAEGLGIVSGDEDHNLNPNRVITRQEAAVMLYNFMS